MLQRFCTKQQSGSITLPNPASLPTLTSHPKSSPAFRGRLILLIFYVSFCKIVFFYLSTYFSPKVEESCSASDTGSCTDLTGQAKKKKSFFNFRKKKDKVTAS